MYAHGEKYLISLLKKSDLTDIGNLQNMLDLAKGLYAADKSELSYCLKVSSYVKDIAYKLLFAKNDARFELLYWDAMHFEAPHLFESFLYYVEKSRSPKKKFYKPRERTLHIVVQDLQDLEDGLIEFYGLSLPPRVGKSTLCIFFLAWVMGRHPELHNAMGGHSGILAKGFYKEVLTIITSSEYTWSEIFPDVKFESKSADEFTINLGDADRFATLTCRGIDGTWTGAVDVSSGGYLYVDDLIRDRAESLSAIRLNGRYQDYLNVMVDRKNDGAKELMVGTRWNVMDPLGRNEEKFRGNPKARFRKIPALNEKDESNFQYDYGVGFSTEYYKELRGRLDKNEWEAKYQQRPFVREGLLFPADELRYYNGVLPEGDARNVSACDVAWGSGDSLSMPVGREYENGDIYIKDWVFNKGTKEVTIPIVAGKIMGNEIRQIQFEANNGGDMYCDKISELLSSQKYRCSCTHKKAPGNMEKIAKIAAYSGDIKRRCIFLAPEHQPAEYRAAMDELCMTVQIGKNEHDDAADSITQLMMAVDGGNGATVSIIERPF